jgi:hypothetical protein
VLAEEGEFFLTEAEVPQFVQHSAGAGDHPIPPSSRQMAREHLEDRPPVGRAAAEGGLQHRQLIVICEQRSAHGHSHEFETTAQIGQTRGCG